MADAVQDLTREFPEKVWKIHKLVETDFDFARLYDEYNALTEAVLQADGSFEGVEAPNGKQMRQVRYELKLKIWDYLKP